MHVKNKGARAFYEKLGFEWSAACFAVYFDNNETPTVERRGTPGAA